MAQYAVSKVVIADQGTASVARVSAAIRGYLAFKISPDIAALIRATLASGNLAPWLSTYSGSPNRQAQRLPGPSASSRTT
jgi:hypothetical protein